MPFMTIPMILEKSVGSRKSTQAIGAPSKPEKLLITNKVTTNFSDSLCTLISYVSFSRPIDLSRMINRKLIFFMTCLFSVSSYALEVNISPDLPYVTAQHDGRFVKIQRIQDKDNRLEDGFTKTSRQCPPFCVQPIRVAPGVNTIGELELLDFIASQLKRGSGVVVDARTPAWHKKGTIPGSINIPFTQFDSEQAEEITAAALARLGVSKKSNPSFIDDVWDEMKAISGDPSAGKIWDFSQAKEVVLWCNGMWCGQSPTAIKGLLALGYPPEKIHYYRGGMQAWKQLGLTVIIPGKTTLSQRR
ncbi:hypothetical protein MNBD_GAMMA13-96 [hydrothermal vent metagenome]|uniref:Rhodanese domain-containing protein n=1 Tax=hydrothermal vent metagenome TaxID=652676 RepID=A0A3B0YAW1_9ZZZZ